MQHGKSGILAQIPATQGRKLGLRWLLAASTLPLFAIITAFGIVPQALDQDVPIQTVVEDVTLPLASVAEEPALPIWQADEIQRDDTLSTVLNRLNVLNSDALDFIRHSPDASALPSQLRPGRQILAKTMADGELVELLYETGTDTALRITHVGQEYKAEHVQLNLVRHTEIKSGEIQSSLFGATDAADIPDSIAIQLAEIFSSDIDFHLDLRKGDRFSVIYEANYYQGQLVKAGRILAAEFINQGGRHQALLYNDADGHANYYTPAGRSLHKSFLRSPLEFSRISSGFSLARFHPVLQKFRAHKGVDYAAPIGTRIKATADGSVQFVGSQNGYGNVIMLQHAGGISTVYGHLSRFAPGLKRGQRISQGQVIGQVGMSGMATGPHLHYEFRVHGEHRDPLKVALPPAMPLVQKDLAAFNVRSAPLLTQLGMIGRTYTALAD